MEHEHARTNQPRSDEAGQTMAEYAVVLAIITLVIVASLTAFGGAVGEMMDTIVSYLS